MQPGILFLFGLVLMLFPLSGCDRGERTERPADGSDSPSVAPADVVAALQRWRCLACHRPSTRHPELASPPAPALERVGRRLRASWVSSWLSDEGPRPRGRGMPRVFRGWPQKEKERAVADLVAFLLRDGQGPFSTPGPQLSSDAFVGGRLFTSVGCVACHGRADLADLALKTDLPHLVEFLRDPVALHPDGRMPSLALTPSEARAIALFLMAPPTPLTAGRRRGGLLLECLEADDGFREFDAGLSAGRVVSRRTAERFTAEHRSRDDRFGLRYRGILTIPRGGAWTFSTRSDDGSWLWIDGELVVRNGGLHGPSTQRGTIVLTEGPHAFQVAMYEHEGGELLEVRCQGPTGESMEIPPEWLSHRELSIPTPRTPPRTDDGDPARGARLYVALGCAACHEEEGEKLADAPALADLSDAGGGCLDPDPDIRAPSFDLSDAERTVFRGWLRAPDREHLLSVDDAVVLSSRLGRLGCLKCHERDGRGGPDAATDSLFVGTADLGDEGRLPPRLTGVGAKLTTKRLRTVLERGTALRPFMRTRMPRFGRRNVASLPDLFAKLDRGKLEERATPGRATAGVLESGRRLVGRKGFNCITCHRFGGVGDPRNHTVDLVGTTERIRFAWFRRLLTHPSELNPGTRMPPYWSGGTVDFPEILGGDREAQIAAIWQYLEGADKWPAPHGLDYDLSAYELDPVDRPIYFGAFFRGVGPKTLCVGFPEGVHIAYDMARVRLAKVWKGAFVNAAGTWTERGGKLEVPDSLDVLDLPSSPTFARLDSPDAVWPEETGHRGAWAYRGHERDAAGRPTFLGRLGDVELRETVVPVARGSRRGILRRFELTSATEATLTARLARGETLRAIPDGFAVGPAEVRVHGGTARLVRVGDETELRVEIRVTPQGANFEVVMTW